MPKTARLTRLWRIQVVMPIDVTQGLTLPWFGEPGMGVQYLMPCSIQTLIDQGFLVELFL